MVNPRRFYTYAYLRKDRTPYYIGKGNGNRAYYKYSGIKPPKDKSRVIFLKKNLTEEQAFKHEIYMISVFGRKDLGTGILHNKTDGGEGFSGIIRSEEWKRKQSEVRRGKNNPNYGIPLSEEHKRNISESKKGKLQSEETKRKKSEAMKGKYVGENASNYGKKWWNDNYGNTKFSVEYPGEGWFLGQGNETKRKKSKLMIGKYVGENSPCYDTKWWNDGCGNNKRSVECPGEGWVLGRGKEYKIKQSEEVKGKKWWNDGCGNSKMSLDCPGEGWKPGRK